MSDSPPNKRASRKCCSEDLRLNYAKRLAMSRRATDLGKNQISVIPSDWKVLLWVFYFSFERHAIGFFSSRRFAVKISFSSEQSCHFL